MFECCKDIGHLMVYTGNGFDQDLNLAANAAVVSKPKLGLPMGGCWLIFGRLGCWVGTHHALYGKSSCFMSLLLHTRLVSTSAYCSLSDTSPPVYFHSMFLGMTGLCWFLLLLPIWLPVSPGLALQMYSQMSARGDGMKDG